MKNSKRCLENAGPASRDVKGPSSPKPFKHQPHVSKQAKGKLLTACDWQALPSESEQHVVEHCPVSCIEKLDSAVDSQEAGEHLPIPQDRIAFTRILVETKILQT